MTTLKTLDKPAAKISPLSTPEPKLYTYMYSIPLFGRLSIINLLLVENGIAAPLVDTLMFFPTLQTTWKEHRAEFQKADFVNFYISCVSSTPLTYWRPQIKLTGSEKPVSGKKRQHFPWAPVTDTLLILHFAPVQPDTH